MWTIIQGDARRIPLGDNTVQCVVTSPPFWGLRDYSLPSSVWGGEDHEHEWGKETIKDSSPQSGLPYAGAHSPEAMKVTLEKRSFSASQGSFCPCGAWLGVLGLEPDVGMYVGHMVEIFREVKRVLRSDGTCWINLGSSYASANSGPNQSPSSSHGPACGNADKGRSDSRVSDYAYSGLCDGCLDAIREQSHNSDMPQRKQRASQLDETIGHDSELPASGIEAAAASLPSFRESTKPESSRQLQGECFHCANCGVCLSVLRSSLRDGRLCARRRADPSAFDSLPLDAQGSTAKSYNKLGTEGIDGASTSRTKGRVSDSFSYHSLTIAPHKVKDLVNVPFYVAEALRADGWWLRSDIIWSKPNPMPESVTDRPTRSHEYVFLLTKAANYYYDQEAVKEPLAEATLDRGYTAVKMERHGGTTSKESKNNDHMVRQGKGWWDNPYIPNGRNLRSVWHIPTQPFPEAHFATFPQALVEPCIKAGTSEKGACAECGSPWERVVEKGYVKADGGGYMGRTYDGAYNDKRTGSTGKPALNRSDTTLGWQPTCECVSPNNGPGTTWYSYPPKPCLVLDPFAGSGTVGVVCLKLGRSFVGIELKPDYCEMANKRVFNSGSLLDAQN